MSNSFRTALVAAIALLLVAALGARAQTGYNSLFIGNSFFVPFADGMPFHTVQAGIAGHEQTVFFSSGASGAPEALWNDASKRAEIQAVLDSGDVELFGMTYHPDYPSSEGYENWISYALAQNPDTRIMLALPWSARPASTSATDYADTWLAGHATEWHDLIDYLRGRYPGVEIFCNPYGQSAVELRLLFEAGNLPDVSSLVGDADDAIYTDRLGHPGNILTELGQLVWLNAIYDVDLSTYAYEPEYITDLKGIARAIMNAHDATYAAQPISAKKLLIKKNKIVVISRDPSVSAPVAGSPDDPRCGADPSGTVKASMTVLSVSSGQSHSTDLPCQNWQLIGSDSDPKGYKYRDRKLDDGTAKTVVWKSGKLLKAVLQGKGPSTLDFDLQMGVPQGSAAAILTSGSTGLCTACDPFKDNDGSGGKKFLGKNCPVPARRDYRCHLSNLQREPLRSRLPPPTATSMPIFEGFFQSEVVGWRHGDAILRDSD